MLQGVLFDMDGLMFDTERIGRDGWHKAAEILHIDLPEEIIAAMRGTGTDRCREIFNAAIPGSLYDTAHDLRLRYADEVIAADGVPVKPGLPGLLRWLKAAGIPAVLATSTRREKALAYLQQTDVERYFTAAVFGPEVARPKPAPHLSGGSGGYPRRPRALRCAGGQPKRSASGESGRLPGHCRAGPDPRPGRKRTSLELPCKRPARGTANFAEGTRKTIRSTIMEYVIGALLLASFFGLAVYAVRGGNLMIGMLIIGTLWTVLPLFGNTFATNPDFIAAYPGVTDISFVDAITKVYQSGPEGWGSVLVNVVFGAWFGRVLLETGIADALIRKTVELGGDKPIVISVLLSIVTTAIFSTLFGAGAVVAIGVIILPILMSLGIPKVLAVGSFMMSVGAGMYLNPVLSGQFLAFFLDENGKQLITYDDPARLRWAVIGMLVQLGMVIVMTAVSLRKKKTVHAWVASAARRARPGYVPTKALIAPILPVLLLVIFKVPIILGFTLASLYAMLVCGKMKSFRGVCRTINKDFYDGVVDTAPLVGFLLMIPIFNKSAELCVPYFNALLGGIIPNSTLVISIFFALLAPLGLFRGPFTLFGCGAATLGILKGIGFSTPYLYALMVIPSITMNVSICMTQSWIAWGVSYAKVSTREHLKKTLPYAWITCAIMQVITFVMFG